MISSTYIPIHRDIFGVSKGQYGDYLKASEVRDMLVMYMKSQGLEMGRGGKDHCVVCVNVWIFL